MKLIDVLTEVIKVHRDVKDTGNTFAGVICNGYYFTDLQDKNGTVLPLLDGKIKDARITRSYFDNLEHIQELTIVYMDNRKQTLKI